MTYTHQVDPWVESKHLVVNQLKVTSLFKVVDVVSDVNLHPYNQELWAGPAQVKALRRFAELAAVRRCRLTPPSG